MEELCIFCWLVLGFCFLVHRIRRIVAQSTPNLHFSAFFPADSLSHTHRHTHTARCSCLTIIFFLSFLCFKHSFVQWMSCPMGRLASNKQFWELLLLQALWVSCSSRVPLISGLAGNRRKCGETSKQSAIDWTLIDWSLGRHITAVPQEETDDLSQFLWPLEVYVINDL